MSFKIITTTNVTRSSFTTQHQTCNTKTKTDVFGYKTGLVPRPTVSDHITDYSERWKYSPLALTHAVR